MAIDRVLAGGAHILRHEYDMVYFPGDDMFAANRPRGLPIGNQTSQFWANVYLHPLDMFIKQELHCRAYVRYCDDMLLFAHDKATLHRWREQVIARAAQMRLTLHENRAHSRPVSHGIPFLGWVVFPYRQRLKRRNIIGFARRFRRLREQYALGTCTLDDLKSSMMGWLGHVQHGNTRALRRSLLRSNIPRKGEHR